MTRQYEAGAIIAHYLKALTQASGRRWTEHNERDMQRLGELLAEDQVDCIAPFYQPAPEPPAEPPRHAEPPRQIDSRVTTVLDTSAGRPRAAADDLNDPSDATYQRWRQQRQREADQARRLIERERERP